MPPPTDAETGRPDARRSDRDLRAFYGPIVRTFVGVMALYYGRLEKSRFLNRTG